MKLKSSLLALFLLLGALSLRADYAQCVNACSFAYQNALAELEDRIAAAFAQYAVNDVINTSIDICEQNYVGVCGDVASMIMDGFELIDCDEEREAIEFAFRACVAGCRE